MSFAYDYDTSETKPAAGYARSPAIQPVLPQHETICAVQAIYDPVSGISYKSSDFLTIRMHPTLAVPQEFTGDPSTLTWTGNVGHHHIIKVGGVVPCTAYPAAVTDNLIFSKGSGTIAGLTVTAVCNTTSNTLAPAGMPRPDLLQGYELYVAANWDGYGAEPITSDTLKAARMFLRLMPHALGEPDIAPGADGTVGLEWFFTNRPLRKLFIDIGPGAIWKGFARKASGEHSLLPEMKIDRGTAHDLARLFKSLEG